MSLGKLENWARATSVSEVLLWCALGQGCQKEPKQRKLRTYFTTKPCKKVVNSFLARISGESRRKGETWQIEAVVVFTQVYICTCFLPRVFLSYKTISIFSLSISKWRLFPSPAIFPQTMQCMLGVVLLGLVITARLVLLNHSVNGVSLNIFAE